MSTFTVIVAVASTAHRVVLQEAVLTAGHRVGACAGTAAELDQLLSSSPESPAVVLVGTDLPGDVTMVLTRHQALPDARSPAVILVGAPPRSGIAAGVDEGVVAHLVGPVTAEALRVALPLAVSVADTLDRLRRDNSQLKQTLAERKDIERARGILMQRFCISEDYAYRVLRSAAQRRRTTMSALARLVIIRRDDVTAARDCATVVAAQGTIAKKVADA